MSQSLLKTNSPATKTKECLVNFQKPIGCTVKATFDLDIQDLASQIAQEVVKTIKPLLAQGSSKDDTLFTVKTLARYLETSTKWVYERVQLKEIPYIKVGKHVRFKKSDIDHWLDSLKVPSMDSPLGAVKLSTRPRKSEVAV